MRTRPLRGALVFGALLASVGLGLAPVMSSVAAERGAAQHSSAMSFDSSTQTGHPAVARIEQRDSVVERALKQRDTFVAVGVAVVALAALARRASAIGFAGERNGRAASSPFCSRAPPLHGLFA